MTGPALLIGALTPILAGLVRGGGFDFGLTLEAFFRWLVATFVIFLTGRVLTARSRTTKVGRPATYTEVFRGLGFAQGAQIIMLLGLVPVLAPFARGLTTLVLLLTTWLAAAVSHELRGWRAIVFPLVMIVVFVVSVAVIGVLLQGGAAAIATLLQRLGFAG